MSAYKEIKFHVKGVSPLIMHNGQLANPLDSHAKAMKEITSKRKKTDDDYEKLAKLEWRGGLYLTAADDAGGVPCVPGMCIEATLVNAAKKRKLGQQAKSAILSDGMWPLIYKGPTSTEKLWEDKNFVDTRAAVVNRNRIMRTRPIFNAWELKFSVHYLAELMNEKEVRDIVAIAGEQIGILDQRPRYGRFVVV